VNPTYLEKMGGKREVKGRQTRVQMLRWQSWRRMEAQVLWRFSAFPTMERAQQSCWRHTGTLPAGVCLCVAGGCCMCVCARTHKSTHTQADHCRRRPQAHTARPGRRLQGPDLPAGPPHRALFLQCGSTGQARSAVGSQTCVCLPLRTFLSMSTRNCWQGVTR
jgi:hypothetical protein